MHVLHFFAFICVTNCLQQKNSAKEENKQKMSYLRFFLIQIFAISIILLILGNANKKLIKHG